MIRFPNLLVKNSYSIFKLRIQCELCFEMQLTYFDLHSEMKVASEG